MSISVAKTAKLFAVSFFPWTIAAISALPLSRCGKPSTLILFLAFLADQKEKQYEGGTIMAKLSRG